MSDNECWCATCKPNDWRTGSMRMIVCEICGNKRCPHATNHNNACTNSNEAGQKGSSWENVKPAGDIKTVEIVKVYPTKYWVETDMFGDYHIMMQHETMEPFCYASFYYNYAYTSNAGVRVEVVNMMKRFGVEEKDIEYKSRGFK